MVVFLLVIIAVGIFLLAKAASGTPQQRSLDQYQRGVQTEAAEHTLAEAQRTEAHRREAERQDMARRYNAPGEKSDWT